MKKLAIAAAAFALLATPAAAQYMYPMASPTARAPVGYAAPGPVYAQGSVYGYAQGPAFAYDGQSGWAMQSPYAYSSDLREQCISDTCNTSPRFR